MVSDKGASTGYRLSPLASFSYKRDTRILRINSGIAADRVELALDNNSNSFVAFLFGIRSFVSRGALIKELGVQLSLDGNEASRIVTDLVEYAVLIDDAQWQQIAPVLSRWTAAGWREPAIHFLSGFGLPFQPDTSGGADYTDQYSNMLKTTTTPQPAVYKGPPPAFFSYIPKEDSDEIESKIDRGLGDLLAGVRRVYSFDTHDVPLQLIHKLLIYTFGNQRYVSTGLGETAQRSYPSGGARHPLEAYLIDSGSADHYGSVYYFDPDGKGLYEISRHNDLSEQMKYACSLKRGIRSSRYSIAISIRWIRHIWKYRYPRSYRMILLELGHALQTIALTSEALGLQSYYCPSYKDDALNSICSLPDPYVESVGMVIGVGVNGISSSEYAERYGMNVEDR